MLRTTSHLLLGRWSVQEIIKRENEWKLKIYPKQIINFPEIHLLSDSARPSTSFPHSFNADLTLNPLDTQWSSLAKAGSCYSLNYEKKRNPSEDNKTLSSHHSFILITAIARNMKHQTTIPLNSFPVHFNSPPFIVIICVIQATFNTSSTTSR